MGTIKVMKMDRAANSRMVITFDVQTSLGEFPFDIMIVDQGSMGANETQGLREFQTILKKL